MDAAFIQQNQIVERYLTGKLPLKGAQDFEHYCREHPETLTSLGLADRINAAIRLLDAAGQPEPWAEKPLPFYQKPLAIVVMTALAGAMLIATLLLTSAGEKKDRRIAVLTRDVQTQPLQPVRSTRTVLVEPSRAGPPAGSLTTIGGKDVELGDFKFDVSWSTYNNFRVTVDRSGQGRVAVLTNLARDSNGHLRIALNSSALGPGDYDLAFEGLDWHGTAAPQAWARFTITH
jgi:hypothetical protein